MVILIAFGIAALIVVYVFYKLYVWPVILRDRWEGSQIQQDLCSQNVFDIVRPDGVRYFGFEDSWLRADGRPVTGVDIRFCNAILDGYRMRENLKTGI